MLSETLRTQFDSYRVGAKIRDLRAAKRIALSQLGDHTGLSAGMLSKIERDQVVPTLPTLMRIAMVFGVGLDHFFGDPDPQPLFEVVRKRDRVRLPVTGERGVSYTFESLDFPVTGRTQEAFLAEFPATGRASDPHRHAGVEFLHVLSGRIAISVHGRETLLGTGDALTFDADFDHAYRAVDGAPGVALVITRLAR